MSETNVMMFLIICIGILGIVVIGLDRLNAVDDLKKAYEMV